MLNNIPHSHKPSAAISAPRYCIAIFVSVMCFLSAPVSAQQSASEEKPAVVDKSTAVVSVPKPSARDITSLFSTALLSGEEQLQGLLYVENHWQTSFVPMVLEIVQLSQNPEGALALFGIMAKQTAQPFGVDVNKWYGWWWSQDEQRHPHYALFKSTLYKLIDKRFERYFDDEFATRIRLDEVRWGGVKQDGIPPLRQPAMIPANRAEYLEDDHLVFGIEVNADARAYPKRILAWHEMFVDTVGDEPVAGVYCTLCGTVILYKTTVDGEIHELGTSGFLYRSNKLMYDKKTQSLWSTMRGEPVIGALAESGIQLERSFVVTTTWGEWRRRHPDTQVLNPDTGHIRDYSEGAAYRDYFATDELMFTVPELDTRLKNKDEVLGLLFDAHRDSPVALSADWLKDHPLHVDNVGDVHFIIVTDASGANRVYELEGGIGFASYDGKDTLLDTNDVSWSVTEAALVAQDKRELKRLPAHRAFWFGWYAAFPDTKLVY